MIQSIIKDLEAFLNEKVIHEDGMFKVVGKKFEGSKMGDLIGYYNPEEDEAILGCVMNDCDLDDKWKGDLTDSRGFLDSQTLEKMDGKKFGGVLFADEWDC